MPTGYTADLYEGKEISFEQFVWNCARAFGALVHMRDDPQGAAISLVVKPDSYQAAYIVQAEEELARYQTMTLEEAEKACQEAYEEQLRSYQYNLALIRAREDRYRTMLAQVMAWEPPSLDHAELKDFMIRQLNQSIDHDCDTSYLLPPVRRNAAAYREQAITNLQHSLKHLRENQAKNEENARNRTEWLQQLNASVPLPSVNRNNNR